MRALLLESASPISNIPLRLVDLPKPIPGHGEILVKVSVCGICRTDLHVIEGELLGTKFPIIPGHQVVGRVAEMGHGTKRFKLGDRVGVAWLGGTCGGCEFCESVQENLCADSVYTGYHKSGGFAEYTTVTEDYAYHIPEVFSDVEAAPLLCAGIVGFRALRRSNLPKGGKLGLYGFGSSAHLTIQVAKHWGAKVFVATRGEKHQALARRLGADWAGDTYSAFPDLVDSAIIFAPVGEIVPVALKALKKGGTVALAGIYMTALPSLPYDECLFHEKNLRSVEANTRRDGLDFLAEAAKIRLKPEVTLFPLEDGNLALEKLKADQISGTGVLVVD